MNTAKPLSSLNRHLRRQSRVPIAKSDPIWLSVELLFYRRRSRQLICWLAAYDSALSAQGSCPLPALLKAMVHGSLAFLSSVVKRTEKLVERNETVTVVHFEVLVVKIVGIMVGAHLDAIQLDLVEPIVALRR